MVLDRELGRYIINGVVATIVHYVALNINIFVLDFKSVGLANFFAATIGILVSFLGSRYYVFPTAKSPITGQALRFLALYAFIAVLHGIFLHVWTDQLGIDFRIGFVFATALQVSMSYFGNKFLVFK